MTCGPAGILFIGDPHLSSRRPGRRRDADHAATGLDKLAQALAVADAEDLVPVILGDLFDRAREDDHALLVRTIRLLRAARHRPWCLVGNHDRLHGVLTDDAALALVREAGAVRTIERSGPCAVLTLAGRRVGLGGTPHGQEIPRDVAGAFAHDGGAEAVVWLTHHDLDFGAPYPGAEPIFGIAGCDLAVNGHMHATHTPLVRGGTLWCNPGNILRMSVDQIDHVPTVWAWRPEARGTLIPHRLRFERDLFDLTGRIARPLGGPAPAMHSVFAELLKAESRAEMDRTADGSVLLEDLERLFVDDGIPADVQAILLELHRSALAGG